MTEKIILGTDSADYHLIPECISLITNVQGMTCEIGLREGGASQIIMQALHDTKQDKTHIAIDPYGNIECAAHDNNLFTRFDYTNEMRDKCMIGIYTIARDLNVNFLFFPLEDTEFFNRYADGVPVYQQHKTINNQYSFVFFDGPHATQPIIKEVLFFNERSVIGTVFLFDDIPYYNHKHIEDQYLFPLGWELVSKTDRKASYKKVK